VCIPLKSFAESSSTGYPIAFLDRQKILEVLYKYIPDKTTILTSKRVHAIENTEIKVIVHCKDGSSYSGAIVAGADGVHSVVRGEMLKYINAHGTRGITEKDETCQCLRICSGDVLTVLGMSAEYSAIFGMSSPTPGIVPGNGHRTYTKDISTLIVAGKGGRTYWFYFSKLDQRYYGDKIPKFRKEDAEIHLKPYLDYPINTDVRVGQLWENRLSFSYVPLEEAKYDNWTYDRFVCLGDSVPKVKPTK
jgi:hypothetical protein